MRAGRRATCGTRVPRAARRDRTARRPPRSGTALSRRVPRSPRLVPTRTRSGPPHTVRPARDRGPPPSGAVVRRGLAAERIRRAAGYRQRLPPPAQRPTAEACSASRRVPMSPSSAIRSARRSPCRRRWRPPRTAATALPDRERTGSGAASWANPNRRRSCCTPPPPHRPPGAARRAVPPLPRPPPPTGPQRGSPPQDAGPRLTRPAIPAAQGAVRPECTH